MLLSNTPIVGLNIGFRCQRKVAVYARRV